MTTPGINPPASDSYSVDAATSSGTPGAPFSPHSATVSASPVNAEDFSIHPQPEDPTMSDPTPTPYVHITTEEAAQQLRQRLKAAGYNSRRVSVRKSYSSMGSSISVTIHDPAISLHAVKELAEPAECIDRCSITGEILSGGNRYLDVQHSKQAREQLEQAWTPRVLAARDAVERLEDNHGLPIEGASVAGEPVILHRNAGRDCFTIHWPADGPVRDYSLRDQWGVAALAYDLSQRVST